MARKVVVVLSQSPRRSPARQQLEEQLVTELLLEDRVEVNVIPDLSELEDDETGQLCLEGIGGDMVLLAWHAPPEIFRGLLARGIAGRMGSTTQTAAADAQRETVHADGTHRRSPRSLYCLDLHQFNGAAAAREEIRRIQDAAAVETMSILNLLAPPPPRGPRPTPPDQGHAPAPQQVQPPPPQPPAHLPPAHSTPSTSGQPAPSSPDAASQQAPAEKPPAETASAETASAETALGQQAADAGLPASGAQGPAAEPPMSATPLTEEEQLEAQLDDLVDELDRMDW